MQDLEAKIFTSFRLMKLTQNYKRIVYCTGVQDNHAMFKIESEMIHFRITHEENHKQSAYLDLRNHSSIQQFS